MYVAAHDIMADHRLHFPVSVKQRGRVACSHAHKGGIVMRKHACSAFQLSDYLSDGSSEVCPAHIQEFNYFMHDTNKQTLTHTHTHTVFVRASAVCPVIPPLCVCVCVTVCVLGITMCE